MFNYDQPSTISAVPRIICIGDVHGDLGRVIDIFKSLKIIDNNTRWIAEPRNTIVVQLGDQIDSVSRGSTKEWETVSDIEVIKFMEQLDSIAQREGGRVISLLGNHELMNILGDFTYVSPKSLETSGGIEMRKTVFNAGGHISHILSKRNIIVKIGNFTFCHGGLLPFHLHLVDNNHCLINTIVRKFLREEPLKENEKNILNMNVIGPDGILWTRKYFELTSLNEMEELRIIIQDVCNRMQCKSILVGHSAMSHVTPMLGGALWFTDACLSRSYGSTYNEVIEILYDDDPEKNPQFNIINIQKND